MKKKVLVCALAMVMALSATACSADGKLDKEESKQLEDLKNAASEAVDNLADAASEAIGDAVEGIKDSDAVENLADAASEAIGDAVNGKDDIDFSSTTTKEWGDFTIDVPKGMEFSGGDFLDDKDTSVFSVKKSELSYFDFKEEDKDTQKQQYEYNKSTYTEEQKDVSGKIGDIDWTGFQYSDGFGGQGIELYAEANGKYIRVSATFGFDDEVTQKLLATLKVK